MTATAQLADQTAALERTVRALDDLAAPSRCAGWSRAHVINHLARNADALVGVVHSVTAGEQPVMYASAPDRDRDIDAGVDRPAAAQVADLIATNAALAAALDRFAPSSEIGVQRVPNSEPIFPASALAAIRLREVVFHHVDLDSGFGFADLDSDLQLDLLEGQVSRLATVPDAPAMRIRTDEGDTFGLGEDGPLVTGTRAGVLAWLARQLTEGVRSEALPALPTGV